MVHIYARYKFCHKRVRQSKVVLSSPHLWLTLNSCHSHHKNYLIPYTCHFWSIHSIGLVPAPAGGGLAGSSIKIWITSTHNHQCQLLNMRQLYQRIKQRICFAINFLFNVLLSQASNWTQKRFASAYKHFSTELRKAGILQETLSMFKGRQEVDSWKQ